MPELPEVETIRRTLEPHLVGGVVREVRLDTPSVWRGLPPGTLVGRTVVGLRRRGKHILMALSGDMVLHLHLGMTGRLVFVPAGGLPPPDLSARHLHVRFALDRGQLHYWDQRRFGYLELIPGGALGDHPRLKLGPEPLDEDFTPAGLGCLLAGRRAPVKALLLDQRILAGLGNIYADEALHRAGIDPLRPAGTLDADQVNALWRAMREVLGEAIAARGTTFSDYRDGEGEPGGFASRLRVYGREGEACPRCGTTLLRRKVGGRSTYFCPGCQR